MEYFYVTPERMGELCEIGFGCQCARLGNAAPCGFCTTLTEEEIDAYTAGKMFLGGEPHPFSKQGWDRILSSLPKFERTNTVACRGVKVDRLRVIDG